MDVSTRPPGLSPRSMAILTAFAAALFLVDFGPGWVLTYHEAYFAQPAREMIATGDWIIPRVAGVPSWQKPPLTHWMIAATMLVLRTEAEWAVRLPTLLSTTLSAIFIAAMAARWFGDRTGRLAGLIQLTTFSTLFQGRLAESDMPLCAAISGGMLALAVASAEGRGWARWLYHVAAGASFLIKGPFGPVLLGGTGLLYAIIQRDRRVWRTLFDPLGLITLVLLCGAWPIAAYRIDPSILPAWRVHNVDRFTGVYDGRKNPLFYLYIIPAILLPWAPVVIGGGIAAFRNRQSTGRAWNLPLCWLGVGLLLIQLAAWKHKHYPIPVLPPASIFAAFGLSRYLEKARRDGFSPAAGLAVAIAGFSVAAAIYGVVQEKPVVRDVGLILLVGGVGLAVAFRLRRMGRIDAAPAVLFATIVVIVILNQSFLMPRYDRYRPQTELARRVNATVPEGQPLCLVEVPSPQILFYFQHPLRRFDTRADFARWLDRTSESGPFYVVGPRSATNPVATLGSTRILDYTPTPKQLTALELTPDPLRVASAIRLESLRR